MAGVGLVPFGKYPDRGLKSLAAEAVSNCMQDAGIGPGEIQFAFVANAVGGLITGQECIAGQVALQPLGIGGIPILNVENACASGSSALFLGVQAIKAGQADIVLALGMEKLTHPERRVTMAAFGSGVDVELRRQRRSSTEPVDEKRDASDEGGTGSKRVKGSVFMDIYAARIRRHMEAYGTTAEQMAAVSVKSHKFGSLNPYAQFRTPVTVEQVLNDKVVASPLTVMMCSPIGDGAAAALIVSEDFARSRGLGSRPRIVASVLTSASVPEKTGDAAEERAIRAAYEQAGIGAGDLDVAEVHDATSPAEMLLYESLGLCEPGGSGKLVDTGATDLGGVCPVNTSGGLVSRGHPIAATGLAQIAELSWQLRGECGDRQVESARVALAQCGGGYVGGDVAAETVHILVRP